MCLLRLMLVAILVIAGGCSRSRTSDVSWRVRFGPVIGDELIVGHVVADNSAWLTTGGNALVRIDLDDSRHTRTVLHPLGENEHVWGLATTRTGDMWTLVGQGELAEFTEDAEIVRRIRLTEPHVGVFGSGRELVFQIVNMHPPADALAAGPPGGAARHGWSGMRTRDLPFNRNAVDALNLVSCGSSAGTLIPCWFPDQAVLTLTDRSGNSHDVALDGLRAIPPQIQPTSDNPGRPIRDAFVTNTNAVWVLGSGEPPDRDSSGRPGGWVLARYDVDGRLFRRVRLPEPARLLLGAREDRCLLLSWGGRVVEVQV